MNAVLLASKAACISVVRSTIQKLELFGTLTDDEHQLHLKSKGKFVEEESPVKLNEASSHESQAKLFVNEFMRKTVTNYVDEVCMYVARREKAEDASMVPLRLVPSVMDTNSEKYKNPIMVEVENERG